MSNKGYVYILTNPSMPGLVKIGKTTRDVFKRSVELYQTGVPRPFTVYHSVFAPDCHNLEVDVHRSLNEYRVSPEREFFELPKSDAMQKLEDCLREQVEEWLDEFIPDHTIVNDDEFVDIGAFNPDVYRAFEEGGAVWPDFHNVLYEIGGDDIKPAIKRWAHKKATRIDEMYKEATELKIVGEE